MPPHLEGTLHGLIAVWLCNIYSFSCPCICTSSPEVVNITADRLSRYSASWLLYVFCLLFFLRLLHKQDLHFFLLHDCKHYMTVKNTSFQLYKKHVKGISKHYTIRYLTILSVFVFFLIYGSFMTMTSSYMSVKDQLLSESAPLH